MPHPYQRTPWPPDFPDVIVHGDVRSRNAHPFYSLGKSGDKVAALKLAGDMLTVEGLAAIQTLIGARQPFLLPVSAIELSGFNAIPDAMAQIVALQLGLPALSGVILQANRVAHTKADGWRRLKTPPEFTGEVIAGADYFLLDDHVGFGGTLANLRGHIECAGGNVIGMSTLTETREARKIAIRPATAFLLNQKHGQDLDSLWRNTFGYGADCLTDIEAGYLARVESLDAIRTRMAAGAE